MRNGLNSCRQEGSPMFEEILITQLNDFIFCPASIYFHNLYGETDKMVYQSTQQINGTAAHKSVDQATYTTRKDILSIANKEAIEKLDGYLKNIVKIQDDKTLLGLEGSAARVYFPQIFDIVNWKVRKPRIKCDYINSTLDIGYNLLFNMIDSLLQVYGFDVYCGIYHKEFYMRKSLACDMVEPLRPIIDMEVRKAINLKQCKQDDFELIQGQYCLNYKKSPAYVSFLMEAILEQKDNIFCTFRIITDVL